MKAVLQRVSEVKLEIYGKTYSQIEKGLLVLLGVQEGDTRDDAEALCSKIVNLRIFEDDNGKMNLSLLQTGGEIMVVSNFTLCADCKKGRRPSFVKAEEPERAELMYEYFVGSVKKEGVKKVACGVFGADMKIKLLNDGPVTIILDSHDLLGR